MRYRALVKIRFGPWIEVPDVQAESKKSAQRAAVRMLAPISGQVHNVTVMLDPPKPELDND